MRNEERPTSAGQSATQPSSLMPHASHRHQIRIRYAETDNMGVVYYANYLTFFEVGRVEYLRSVGSDYKALEDSGLVAAVTEALVRYTAPARFDDVLTICTRLGELGKVRIRFEYQIWRESDSTLVASGYTEHALLERGTLRPVRLPEAIRDGIRRFEARARQG